MCVCFLAFAQFSPAAVGIFSRSRLRDTQGDRVNTTVQVWVPGGLRGACSGCSMLRNLASNNGVAFHGARAEQDNAKPKCQLFCSAAAKDLLCGSHGIQQQSQIKFVWTTMRVCAVCAMIRVRVYVRAGLCICMLESHTSAFWYICSACCLSLIHI